MKKLSTYLFLILFSFSAPSFADDLSYVQIEGMSIGDKLSDHFTAREIKNFKKKPTADSNRFTKYSIISSKFKTYDEIVVFSGTGEGSDYINGLQGFIYLTRNIITLNEYRTTTYDLRQCEKIMEEIENEFTEKFKHLTRHKKTKKSKRIFFNEESEQVSDYEEFYYVSKIVLKGEMSQVRDKASIYCFNFHKLSEFADFLRVEITHQKIR